jgi:ADP-heptose:LPS heptosyltransferase
MASISEKISLYKQAYASLLNKKSADSANSRVLLIELAGLGDSAVLVDFAYQFVKMGYQVDIASRKENQDLWREFLPEAEFYPIDINLGYSSAQNQYFRKSFHKEYKAVFAISISSMTAYIASFAISAKKIGIIEKGRKHKTYSIVFTDLYNSEFEEFYADRYTNTIKKVFPDFEVSQYRYSKSISANNTIILHPGGKWEPRRWKKERFAELANKLSLDGYNVEIITGWAEKDWLEYFKNSNLRPNIKLFQIDSVAELIGKIKEAKVLIGNDSGPAHLARLIGAQTIVLWGPGNYARIRPVGDNVYIIKKDIDCRPCRQYVSGSVCKKGNNDCLDLIQVDEVYNYVRDYFKSIK